MNKNKGFTLIELLVVIAIIGILASVVLASLSSARDKGKDAAVKSQLASMKAQAELFFAKSETYANVCGDSQVNNGFGGASGPGLLSAAHASSGSATPGSTGVAINNISSAQVSTQTVCNDSDSAWAVSVPLATSSSGSPSYYCSDNTGLSKETTVPLDSKTDYVCN
ncbi:MAG: type II secretion system protein [Candidatus Nomurabacteria bacterium]